MQYAICITPVEHINQNAHEYKFIHRSVILSNVCLLVIQHHASFHGYFHGENQVISENTVCYTYCLKPSCWQVWSAMSLFQPCAQTGRKSLDSEVMTCNSFAVPNRTIERQISVQLSEDQPYVVSK